MCATTTHSIPPTGQLEFQEAGADGCAIADTSMLAQVNPLARLLPLYYSVGFSVHAPTGRLSHLGCLGAVCPKNSICVNA